MRGWLGIIAVIALLAVYAGLSDLQPAGTPGIPPPQAAEAAATAPILVVTSSNANFGAYYAEILRTEGINAFDVVDISAVSTAMLAAYDLVLLAQMALTVPQAAMFSNWVQGGGNFIAMAPDPKLAGLLGLSPTGRTLSEGYLRVDGATDVGRGIARQTMQFHGSAMRYALADATALATLYATATTATENPAVTLNQVGSKGGQAAAFAYDLARSVVLTRQGNPAWAAQERDGFSPIRPDDKFYGAAAGDPQPDWVAPAKIAIPQADEQQRLLANLILLMNLARKPLPRFWYFPFGKRAVVIMTGDDHANNGTAGRFDQFIAKSPPGCSLAKWECIRGTSYLFPDTPLSNAQAGRYAAQGFEVGLHVNTGCKDYTPAALEAFYRRQVRVWKDKYRSVTAPGTQRHHCIVWSDWASAAKVQRAHGMRFDVSYYHWPPGWARDVPGIFTGSAMPMRFADLDGTVIDVYGAATQMTDESGQSYPFTVDTLLDRALGSEEYFGAYTVNAHTDYANSAVSDAVVASALERGVPVVSSRQMLTWLDARNSSSFKAVSWNGKNLDFSVHAGADAIGLQALLPMHTASGRLSSVTREGAPLDITAVTVKGIEYAAFLAATGRYVASYGTDPTLPVLTGMAPRDREAGVDATASIRVGFSKPIDPATINGDTFELRDATGNRVAAKVAYDPSTFTATLAPSAPLPASARYTVTIRGGNSDAGVRDVVGNPLAADARWSFSTHAGFLFPAASGVAQPRRGRIRAVPGRGWHPAVIGTG